jgi:flagellar basal-body rod protein FlgC
VSFFDAISIAASGLTAERVRMDVTSENLANANTTQGANGQPYQRQEVVLQQVGGGFGAALSGAMGNLPGGGAAAAGVGAAGGPAAGGVQVGGIVSDPTPDQLVYDPGNPAANAQGYVRMPNVNPVNEMVDMIDESRSYQSDVTAMGTAKTMYEKTLDLLK